MSGVTLKEVTKSFDETKVIHGVNLEIPDGELCVFVGPSGCGKSTLLRMIAGLEQVTSGSIEIGSRDVTTADPADRGVAMVFQNYALYPHMTVAENMGFGLKMNGVAKNVVKEKVLTAAKFSSLKIIWIVVQKLFPAGNVSALLLVGLLCEAQKYFCLMSLFQT